MLIRAAAPEDAEAITRVHGETWRAAYRGLVPDAFLDGFGREPGAVERRRRWIGDGKTVTLVAVAGGGVSGFSFGGPARDGPPGFDAEVYALYVLPEHQGRGLGGGLFRGQATALAERGFRALSLWVLGDNSPARSFYQSLGGRYLGEKSIRIGGADLLEVAYGWDLPIP